jgi:hypothetical protein
MSSTRQKLLVLCAVVLLGVDLSFAQRVTEATDNGWTFGPNQPVLRCGETRADGSNGCYHYLPIGTSAYYYEVMTEGEGAVDFWIFDPFKCSANPDPGYGTQGPGWGLMNRSYIAMTVSINRASQVAGCLGYSPWSTAAPFSPYWFKDGIRGSNSVPWQSGWFRWTVDGTLDNITFTLHDVTYCITDGPPDDDVTTGDCIQTYDATSAGATWAAVFGSGWKGFWLKGDVAATGIEDISADVTDGSGVFYDDFHPKDAVFQPYTTTSWGTIKALFR